jgi:SP family arabinose:H+ symporter-like MFS transporter
MYSSTIAIIAALGGFLFGFDTAVISGALSPLIKYFNLEADPIMQGWMVSSVLLGSVFGAAISGFLADYFGRKISLLIAGTLFIISAVGAMIATSFSFFVIARLIGGFAVGIVAMLAPLYISEISPPKIRGRMVTMYQFAVTLGVLTAFFTNDFFRVLHENLDITLPATGFFHWIISDVWRIMLGAEMVPCVLFFGMLIFIPESPRFMMMKGKEDASLRILERVSGTELAQNEAIEIKEAIQEEKGSLNQLFKPGLRKATFIALFLSIVSQLTGIDIVLHYGPVIFERAGFTFGDSLQGQKIIGTVLVVFTLVAMWKVDELGRRKLLVIGNTGIVISLLVMGYLFYAGNSTETGLLVAISLFIISFSFSMGPIPWIIFAEIFPTKIRGRAMAIATLALFSSNWFVAQMFPYVSSKLGEHGTFWLLGILALPTFYVCWKVLPETKGKSLEEIERSWHSGFKHGDQSH